MLEAKIALRSTLRKFPHAPIAASACADCSFRKDEKRDENSKYSAEDLAVAVNGLLILGS